MALSRPLKDWPNLYVTLWPNGIVLRTAETKPDKNAALSDTIQTAAEFTRKRK